MTKLSPKKIIILVTLIAISSLSVHFGVGEALRVSEKPSEYIGVTFSILAASLFAVISIVGDPSMLLSGSWRKAWSGAKEVQLRLMRLTWLFVLYLIVLGLLVVTEIIEEKCIESLYFIHDIFGFLSIFAFLASLLLPFEIKEIQISRLEQEISARRNKGKPKS